MAKFNCKKILSEIFLYMVDSVNPTKLITENVKINNENLHICDKVFNIKKTNLYLIGFGKAVLGMAYQCKTILKEHLKHGVICIPEDCERTFKICYDLSLKDSIIQVYEGAKNNLPDENAERGASAIIEFVKSLNHKHDSLIVLISGGGSALFPKPISGISLTEKLEVIKLLTLSGANITELNTVRKKLSQVKGGGLGHLTYPIKTICLILSDVIDDPLDIIASGPTVPNINGKNSAFNIIQNYNLENKISSNILNILQKNNIKSEIPIVNNSFSHIENFIIGNNSKAVSAGRQYAEDLGFKTVIFSNKVKGLVQNVSDIYINLISAIINYLENNGNYDFLLLEESLLKLNVFDFRDNFFSEIRTIMNDFDSNKKICVMAGGEPTVRVQGNGKGGRNQELALLIALKIYNLKSEYSEFFQKFDVMFLSAGTDGIDGPTDAAGAFADSNVINLAMEKNLNVNDYLMNNDSYNFFSKIDDGSYLIKTGHTGTNVTDVHILVVYEKN